MTDDDLRDAWEADVAATTARLAARFYGPERPRTGPPPTYAQLANEDRAAALGELRAEDAAWASPRDCDRESARVNGA